MISWLLTVWLIGAGFLKGYVYRVDERCETIQVGVEIDLSSKFMDLVVVKDISIFNSPSDNNAVIPSQYARRERIMAQNVCEKKIIVPGTLSN